MSVRYEPAYARIAGPDGKPIGTDAALMLSQIVWLALDSGQADSGGWVQWTFEDCENQTGLSRRQQQRIVPLLETLGIIETNRKGVDGRRNLRVNAERFPCHRNAKPTAPESTEGANRKARNVQTDEGEREGIAPNVQTGKHETCKPTAPESTEGANRIARNVQTLLYKETSKRDSPLLVPPESVPELLENSEKPENPKRAASLKFVPPKCDEAQAYIVTELRGSIADADKFMDWYSANGWRVGKNAMRDWQAAARSWVKRSLEFEAERAARGSPPVSAVSAARNGRAPKSYEESLSEEREALDRIRGRAGHGGH